MSDALWAALGIIVTILVGVLCARRLTRRSGHSAHVRAKGNARLTNNRIAGRDVRDDSGKHT
jgi:hypothetical protein